MSEEDDRVAARIRNAGNVDDLGEELERAARQPYLDAAALRSDDVVGDVARKLLVAAGPVGLRVLISRDPTRHEADIGAVGAAEAALRARILKWLESKLADKSLVPRPVPDPFERSEVKPPPRRICDVAFLAMRRLVHFGEDEMEQGNDASFFLNLADWKKDAVIASAIAANDLRRLDVPEEVETEDGP
jgi:hypothetical protein